MIHRHQGPNGRPQAGCRPRQQQEHFCKAGSKKHCNPQQTRRISCRCACCPSLCCEGTPAPSRPVHLHHISNLGDRQKLGLLSPEIVNTLCTVLKVDWMRWCRLESMKSLKPASHRSTHRGECANHSLFYECKPATFSATMSMSSATILQVRQDPWCAGSKGLVVYSGMFHTCTHPDSPEQGAQRQGSCGGGSKGYECCPARHSAGEGEQAILSSCLQWFCILLAGYSAADAKGQMAACSASAWTCPCGGEGSSWTHTVESNHQCCYGPVLSCSLPPLLNSPCVAATMCYLLDLI